MSGTRGLGALLIAFGAVACAAGPDVGREKAGDDPAEAVRQVREQGTRWIEAVEREDAAGVAAIYAEDALFLPPGAGTLSGRDTIRGLFQAQFEAMDAAYDFRVDEVHVVGDWAWRRGGYAATAELPDGDTLRVDDKFVDIWRRGDDGRWRIVVDIWNANPPPTGSASAGGSP